MRAQHSSDHGARQRARSSAADFRHARFVEVSHAVDDAEDHVRHVVSTVVSGTRLHLLRERLSIRHADRQGALPVRVEASHTACVALYRPRSRTRQAPVTDESTRVFTPSIRPRDRVMPAPLPPTSTPMMAASTPTISRGAS